MNAFSAALVLQEDRNLVLHQRTVERFMARYHGKPAPFRRKLCRLSTESATRRVLGLKGHR